MRLLDRFLESSNDLPRDPGKAKQTAIVFESQYWSIHIVGSQFQDSAQGNRFHSSANVCVATKLKNSRTN